MTSWQFYDDNAQILFSNYISLDFHSIFSDVEKYITDSIKNVLDVGSGSGRDAAALADKGFKVVAVEPSEKMRKLASSYYIAKNITWIDDSLPLLNNINKSVDKYDLILVSAVWMHLFKQEEEIALETLAGLLSPEGVIIITLRLGPDEPDRGIKNICTDDLLILASKFGLTIKYISPVNNDIFNRPQIKWQKIVLSNPLA